jgi:cytosine deaminase
MPAPFVALPPRGPFRLANARVPFDLLDPALHRPDDDALVAIDIDVRDGRFASISRAGTAAAADGSIVDLASSLVLPRFVDPHCHIDKGHIFARSPNPNGTHQAARETVGADREKRWTAEDVASRMDFALRCAFAHGTGALRTHIDSIGKQTGISWPVFDAMRATWKGRIDLQAVALFPTLFAVDDESQFKTIVATVARHGGLLGGLTFVGDAPDAKLALALDRTFAAAATHGLDLDFHVDESDSPNARTLEAVADAAIRARFKGRISAGHCCRLALEDDTYRARVIDKLGAANVGVISLPMCNLYLQDRGPARTPRWRGVAPLHELDASGIAVAVASDNTRDPFYAYGDLDMLEVFREATRIVHFDHKATAWTRMLAAATALIMGLDGVGRIAQGSPADLVITRARTLNELLSRPQSDRIVLVDGRTIDTTLPDYRELDRLSV